MFAPPKIVLKALEPYYPDKISKPVFIYSTIAYKQTRSFKRMIPYLMFATKQHLILFSFMREKKSNLKRQLEAVKIFLRSQVKVIIEKEDFQIILDVSNSEEPIFLNLNNDLERKSWQLLINHGIAPIYKMNIPIADQLCKSVSTLFDMETIQIDFAPGFKQTKYFSINPFLGCVQTKRQIARQAAMELYAKLNGQQQPQQPQINIDLQQEMNIAINLTTFYDIMNCCKSYEFDEGNLISEPVMINEQGKMKKIMMFNQIYQNQMAIPAVQDWNQLFDSYLRSTLQKIEEIKTKHVSVEEVMKYLQFLHNKMNPVIENVNSVDITTREANEPAVTNKSKLNQSMNVSAMEEDIDLAAVAQFQNELSTDLYAKLSNNAKQKDIQKDMESYDTQEEAISFQVTRLLNMMGLFRRQSEQTAVQLIEEFTKFSHEKRLEDPQNQAQSQYYPQVYLKQLQLFQSMILKLKPNELQQLEDKMVKLGPVQGSVYNQIGGMDEIYQLISQNQIQIGEQYLSGNKATNGFPAENFEQSDAQVIKFPNQLPPVAETNQNGINFKICCNKDYHSKLNFRRDQNELLVQDDEVFKQAIFEQQVADALMQEDTRVNIGCLITYQGFSIQCQAIQSDANEYGFVQQGQEVTFLLPEETLVQKIEKIGEKLNIQPHLISVVSNGNMMRQAILGQKFQLGNMLEVLINQLEKEKVFIISQFIAQYQGDLEDQLNQCKYQQLYKANEIQNRVFVSAPLSGMTNISKNILKNASSLLVPDIPKSYIDLLQQSSADDRQKLGYTFNSNKLPVKYVQIIDQKLNPDATISAFMADEDELMKLQKDLAIHLTDLTQQNQGVLDTSLFLKYIFGRLQKIQAQKSLDSAIRWSDSYRTQYIPLLQRLIDQFVEEGKIQLDQVVMIYEYFQLPEYLWLYTANFSSFTEVYDLIRLEIAARASVLLLNQSLRKYKRKIQQFGLKPVIEYDQQTMNQIEEMFKDGNVDYNYLQSLEAKRINYFTGTEEQRFKMTQDSLKLVVVQFLNVLFGLDLENQQEFFDNLNQIIFKKYIQHSFGEDYVKKTANMYAGTHEKQMNFKWEPVSRSSLFQESIEIKIDELTPKMYYEKPHAYRMYLLDRICQHGGLVITDTAKWDFSRKTVFYVKDIIQFVPVTRMATPKTLKEQFNVPYNPITQQAIEIESIVNQLFTSCQKQQFQNQNHFIAAKDQQIMTREPDTKMILNQMRAVHFNFVYYQQITNRIVNCPFEYLMADLAVNLAQSTQKIFKGLKQKNAKNLLDNIYLFVDSLETQKMFIGSALSLCRRNGPVGASVYRDLERILSMQQSFLKEIEQQCPENYLIINKELLSQQTFLTKMKKLPQNAEDAFAVAMKAISGCFSKYSFEGVKLRLKYAVSLVKRDCIKQAIEQLLICEQIVSQQVGQDSKILAEIYSLLGQIYSKQGNLTEAVRLQEQSIDILWRKANDFKVEEDRIQEFINSVTQKIVNLSDQKQIKAKRGNLKLVQDVVQQQIPQEGKMQAMNAKILFEAKLNTYLDQAALLELQMMMQNPEEARLTYIQTINSAKQKLSYNTNQLTKFQLIISQLYFNMAETLLQSNHQKDLQNIKKLSLQALQMRAKVLGRSHFFTLLALQQLAVIDFQLKETDSSVLQSEFILQQLQDYEQPQIDVICREMSLNPLVNTMQLSTFGCFKLLVQNAFQQLNNADQKILSYIQEQIRLSSALDTDMGQQVLTEILESESVFDCVMEMFRKVREERDKASGMKLMNLVKMMNSDYVAVQNVMIEELQLQKMEDLDFDLVQKKVGIMKNQYDQ